MTVARGKKQMNGEGEARGPEEPRDEWVYRVLKSARASGKTCAGETLTHKG